MLLDNHTDFPLSHDSSKARRVQPACKRLCNEFLTRRSCWILEALLRQLDSLYPLSKANHILDLGCGPGQIISVIIQDYGSKLPQSVRILAADVSPDMIRQVQLRRALEVKRDAQNQCGEDWMILSVMRRTCQQCWMIPLVTLPQVWSCFSFLIRKRP